MHARQSIINEALLLMGQDIVADPQAEGMAARLVASVYDNTLAGALALHPWSFATRAVTLARRAEPPEDRRFANAFALPADLARIVMAEHAGGERAGSPNSLPVAAYVVQGNSLCCNAHGVQLLYVPDHVHEAQMPPAFRQLLALMLACTLAYKLTGDAALARQLALRLPAARQEAAHNDGEQANTLPENRPNLFVAIREY